MLCCGCVMSGWVLLVDVVVDLLRHDLHVLQRPQHLKRQGHEELDDEEGGWMGAEA